MAHETEDHQQATEELVRTVSASLDMRVNAATEVETQIAVTKSPGLSIDEQLTVTLDDVPIDTVEVVGPHGGRIRRFRSEPGTVKIDYRATVTGEAEPIAVEPADSSIYLRPSRYAQCDALFGFAKKQFDATAPAAVRLARVVEYVTERLSYIPGSSDPIDGATDTLLSGSGVCRDYAHLVVGLLRALNVPARFVAVYAPGCDPMDFHAVAEALVDGEWVVVDATGLAPRQTLLRIATGRDAADTAFLENHGGALNFDRSRVTAVVAGELPVDDGTSRRRIR